MLADKCLDCKPYNTGTEDVTWETCSLQKWLNEDFYNGGMGQGEKVKIKK